LTRRYSGTVDQQVDLHGDLRQPHDEDEPRDLCQRMRFLESNPPIEDDESGTWVSNEVA
jgi:hypothetical protein